MKLCLTLLSLGFVCCLLAASPRPNVLLICVDDLKPTIGCYGDALAKTPNLDRLAARGMRFDMAYCNQAVCAPSRNNLMLGTRSTTLGIYDLGTHFRRALPDAVTLTQYFMRHGWRAEGIGKILHTGHGNHDDAASWSVPFQSDKVVEYALPENSANGQLPREEVANLLEHGKTGLIKGFKSKRTGRMFDAFLILKPKGAIGFEFPPRKAAPKKTAAKKDEPAEKDEPVEN
jgi:iduronate 2-sulfatase